MTGNRAMNSAPSRSLFFGGKKLGKMQTNKQKIQEEWNGRRSA
jgi:hypothetical protein